MNDILVDAGLLSPVRAGTPAEAAVCDTAWLQAMLDAEAALARAQARLGAVPPHAAETITRAARAERLDLRALAVAARETANPVVGLVAALKETVRALEPEAAEYVHRGSTSQDVFDTGAMLVARRTLVPIRADLRTTADALARLAAEHRDTPMAGRTLALHAVPTTFGLKAAGWRQLALDAARRLDAVDAALPVSLGGAAGTLAGYLATAPLTGDAADAYPDRLVAAFAEETGLARPVLPWHALRSPVADLASALAFTAGALGKMAIDVQSLVRTEVGEVAEPDAPGRGRSSAMPHKRNPVLATLLRSAAIQVPPIASILTQCLVSEDERSAGGWHAEWQPLRECLRLAGGAAHTAVQLAQGLRVRPGRMRENLELTGARTSAERLVSVLAPRWGGDAARKLLDDASREAEETGRTLPQVLGEVPGLGLEASELADLCDPAGYTGAAGSLVDRALRPGP
ncbi:3-carboxy-cis,cis-muconate cycloisomerase [Streptomyces sp. NPDC002055]|uniref:3-carboxy-cis,cis-muconate cycloisomerase n=1 Tax=Streptomyces sp. NPDC002055 TaxID=3154534 RepID=UPI003325E055